MVVGDFVNKNLILPKILTTIHNNHKQETIKSLNNQKVFKHYLQQ